MQPFDQLAPHFVALLVILNKFKKVSMNQLNNILLFKDSTKTIHRSSMGIMRVGRRSGILRTRLD